MTDATPDDDMSAITPIGAKAADPPLVRWGLLALVVLAMTAAVALIGQDRRSYEAWRQDIARVHRDYCASKGYETYTSGGRKCVDRDGNEKAIPDHVWTDAGIDL